MIDSPTTEPLGSEGREGRGRRLAVAGLAIALAMSIGVLVVVRADDENGRRGADSPGASEHLEVTSQIAEIRATITADTFAGLHVESLPIVPAPRDAWAVHTLVLRNETDAPVHVDDTRTATFLSGQARAVLATDDGCGYATDADGSRVRPGCHSDFKSSTIAAHDAVQREITLWRGLAGMDKLVAGDYVLELAVRYRTGKPFHPGDDSPAESGTITIRYNVDE